MAYLQRLVAASRSMPSLLPSVSLRSLFQPSPPAQRLMVASSEIYHARAYPPTMELRPGAGRPIGAAAAPPTMELRPGAGRPIGAAAAPWEFRAPCASAPTMELRPGGGGPSGAPGPAHRSIAAPSEFNRARASAPTTELRPGRGGPSGAPVPAHRWMVAPSEFNRVRASAPTTELRPEGGKTSRMRLLGLEKQKGGLAEGLHAPPTTRWSITSWKLASKHKTCCSGSNDALRQFKRGFYSAGSVPPPPAGPVPPPAGPVPPPPGWNHPFYEEPPLMRSGPPGYLEPDFAKTLKTFPAIIPEVCVDESTYLTNYDPFQYLETSPLVRRKIIHGVEPDLYGVQPSLLLTVDPALRLMRSLPLLARFFHEQHCCLPTISLKDLVISGDGRFRLRGCDVVFREFTYENIAGTYTNISEVFKEMLALSGVTKLELPEDFCELTNLLESHEVVSPDHEYPICYNNFFLPQGNKGYALLRMIDYLLEQPPNVENDIKREVTLKGLPYMYMTRKGTREWLDLARKNCYLKQWLGYRQYGDGRLEFLRFVRAVFCHKLKYGLTDKFVDFLVYATYPKLLPHLQNNLSRSGDGDLLKKLQLEELFPQNLASKFLKIDI